MSNYEIYSLTKRVDELECVNNVTRETLKDIFYTLKGIEKSIIYLELRDKGYK